MHWRSTDWFGADRPAARRSASAAFLLVLSWLGLAGLAAAAANPMADQPPIAQAPYRLDYQGWITLDATVNGLGPYDFIVDSGATITAAFQNLADRQPFAPASRAPIRILGLTGARELPAFVLGDIDAGGARLDNHVGVVLPDWAPPNRPPQGVLGLDFLTRYFVYFDSADREMRLYPNSAAPAERVRGWAQTPLVPIDVGKEQATLYRVHVRVRGKRIPCIVDLGASGTIFNAAAIQEMRSGVAINGDRRSGFSTGTRINDIFDARDQASVVQIASLSIGRSRWRDKLYIVYDAEIFRELGFANKPFCLVGADLFADRSMMFDFARETLYIGPKS